MELFRLLGKIVVDNADANKTIDETTDKAEKTGGKLQKAFGKVGEGAAKIGKVAAKGVAVATGVVATGISAAATGIAAISKIAVKGYADYEQFVGGVETLFGAGGQSLEEYAQSVGKTAKEASKEYSQLMNAQRAVLKDANEAYKTAGLSANEYMETVTSFSAALIKSLDGDTNAAVKKANTAIIDMSDNANKMGTDMASIQNAYQGFAKQNYTMLDNLKLGYGGTKEEMQRLLKDAEKISGQKFDLSSYADIVDAIHVVQTEMGITGTTAKEANTTIQGSLGAMKAAWQNLAVGMADPDQDIGVLIGNMVDTALTFVNNITPRIVETLPRVVDGISQLIQNLSPHIPPLLEQLIPALIKGAIQIVAVLIKDLPNILKSLGIALRDSVKLIFESLGGNDTFSPFINGFQNAMKSFQEKFSGAIEGIKDTWENHLKPAFDAIVTFVQTVLLPAFEFVFKTGIVPVVQTAFDAIKQLWTGTLKPVLDGICDFLTGVFTGDWKRALQGILNIWTGTFNALKTVIMAPLEYVKNRINACVEYIQEKFKFNWELPKLKLPHFNISGSFSFNPPKVPKFSVDWYKKAMDDPMIMNKPTAFGINKYGQIMAGGEAGSEVVSGTDTLMSMISQAVSAQNERMLELLEKILGVLLEYMPEMANMQLVTDTGALVGEITPMVDEKIGLIAKRKQR